MSSTTYNGWTNYETWCVNLWLGNEQSTHDYWREQAIAAWEAAESDATFTKSERARYALADQLKSEIEESAPDMGASMWADLLNAALSEVNWAESANSFLESADLDGYESRQQD